MLVNYSDGSGGKQIYKCKERYHIWVTTQLFGKPQFTWKQLVAQEADIIEDQSAHWEVIWGVKMPPVTSEQTKQRLWNSEHLARLHRAEEEFQLQRNPADI